MITARTDIINHIIKIKGYNTYLEIGVAKGKNLNAINIPLKDSVDPYGNTAKFKMRSDVYFNRLHSDDMYDIIFIDGDHRHTQARMDIVNSLAHLSEGGTIVMHDCNPTKVERSFDTPTVGGGGWNGTVYKSIIELRCTRPDLSVSVVNTDYGCGIIERGSQELWTESKLKDCQNYKYLDKHRTDILNLISVKQFYDKWN